MNYIDFEAGSKAYKLRLNTRNTVALEKVLGCNPLHIFDTTGERLPSVTVMVAILHASLQQYQHGIGMNDAYDIFDDYINDGNSIDDFVYVILDIYRASGIIPKEVESEKN